MVAGIFNRPRSGSPMHWQQQLQTARDPGHRHEQQQPSVVVMSRSDEQAERGRTLPASTSTAAPAEPSRPRRRSQSVHPPRSYAAVVQPSSPRSLTPPSTSRQRAPSRSRAPSRPPSRGPASAPPRRIYFYHRHDPHYGFTNFSPHTVHFKDRVYPTSEHLFQAFKFMEHRPLLAEHIRTFSDRPSVALSEARRFQPEQRSDWMAVNIRKMEETLWHKFSQHAELRHELLATGDAELIEDSDRDSFWGVGTDRKGRNELGKALMRVRQHMRDFGPT